MKNARISNVWRGIKARCTNAKHSAYHNYGGRGITVCKQWLESFDVFKSWAVDNGYADDLEIDRIDNNGNYEPSNCHFVSRKENSRNRRDNHLISAFGETKTLVEWSEDARCEVTQFALMERIYVGWKPEDAILFKRHKKPVRRSTTRLITAFGETNSLGEWARKMNIDHRRIAKRIDGLGWSAEKALSTKILAFGSWDTKPSRPEPYKSIAP